MVKPVMHGKGISYSEDPSDQGTDNKYQLKSKVVKL